MMTPTPESDPYVLPPGVPSVRLTGCFVAPDGRPLTGKLTFAPPSVLTMRDADVIANTVAVVEIAEEDQGRFAVDLIATEAPGMSPSGWTYLVTEKLKGAEMRQYHIMLPLRPGGGSVDLADLAPVSAYSGRYLPVVGPTGAQGPPGKDGQSYTADGQGLNLTGATFSLRLADASLAKSASGLTVGLVPTSKGGTGSSTAAGARSMLGTVGKYSALLPAMTVGVPFDVVHGLNTLDVLEPSVREIATGELVNVQAMVIDANTIRISVAASHPADAFRIAVVG
ncbi:hypothetical protein ACF06W_11520 [Streptomyces albus]|uniref:hypothetical protein n=1 Tax=Streptomyces albus TaxID=1888 RepID=UPI0036FE58DB